LHIFTNGTDNFALNTQLVAFQFVAGLPIVLCYFLVFELQTVYFVLNTSLIVSILFNAIAASFLVSFIQISVQKYTTPVNAALIFAMEPIFASIFSFIFMNEVLTGRGYIGAGLMLLAIFVGDTLGLILNKFKKK
jgi:drug/metabolite transporter (DMT)-like permease